MPGETPPAVLASLLIVSLAAAPTAPSTTSAEATGARLLARFDGVVVPVVSQLRNGAALLASDTQALRPLGVALLAEAALDALSLGLAVVGLLFERRPFTWRWPLSSKAGGTVLTVDVSAGAKRALTELAPPGVSAVLGATVTVRF